MLPTETQNTVAQTLKLKTEDNHLALEALLVPKLQAISSALDYVALLKAFYGYFFPVEQLIDQHINHSHLTDIDHRRKAGYILKDLEVLRQSIIHLPLATTLPAINNVYQAFGALYVLEGSTLGGRGITKMLLKNGAAGIKENEVTFFNGYGTETGPRWMAFLQSLNSIASNDDDVAEMVKAANDTFYFFKLWLQKQLIHE